jgi:hypothetical protein
LKTRINCFIYGPLFFNVGNLRELSAQLQEQRGGQRAAANYNCAAKAFYSCPAIISQRPESRIISKEPQENTEEESKII